MVEFAGFLLCGSACSYKAEQVQMYVNLFSFITAKVTGIVRGTSPLSPRRFQARANAIYCDALKYLLNFTPPGPFNRLKHFFSVPNGSATSQKDCLCYSSVTCYLNRHNV